MKSIANDDCDVRIMLEKSCWTCRNRHVRCDQSPAPCAKCRKAGLECFKKLPVRWVKGVAIRGSLRGHMYEDMPEGIGAAGAEKTNQIQFQSPVVRASITGHNGGPTGVTFGLPIQLQDPSLSNLNEASRYYLDYCKFTCMVKLFQVLTIHSDNKRLCSNFVVYDSNKNPLRNLITISLDDYILQRAVLALAARHLANTGQSFQQVKAPMSSEITKFNRDALFFKHEVIHGLSMVLSDSNEPPKDTRVASIFLLILLDLLESGTHGWQAHLNGAKSLMASSFDRSSLTVAAGANRGSSPMLREIWDFVTQQINLVETLGSLFLRSDPRPHDITFDQKRLTQESIDNSFLACPDFLLRAIRCISSERDSITRSDMLCDTVIQAHIQSTKALLDLVEHFDCHRWASNLRQSRHSRNDVHSLSIVSRVYQIGALLYGRRLIAGLKRKATSQDILLSELLGLLNTLSSNRPLLKCVLWPIFVAGLECRSLAQKKFFIDRLEEFWMTTNCLNVINAATILREYWKQDDRGDWVFDIVRFGRAWLLI